MTTGHTQLTAASAGARRWTTVSSADVLSDWAKGITAYSGDASAPDPEDTIVFGAGIPDPPTLPREALLAAARRVLEKDGPGALRYGSTQGDLLLREWLAERLNRRDGTSTTPENFFLTNGSGQAIQMIAAAFANPGDTVLVERPSYPGGMRTFRAYGAQLVGVDMDDDGIRIEALDATLRRLADEGRTPPLLYTMPNLHNPTGLTTSLARREQVADLCDEYGVLIVEDDAYGEVRVEGGHLPSYYKITDGRGGCG
jgi:2-aminoadipate transaminase